MSVSTDGGATFLCLHYPLREQLLVSQRLGRSLTGLHWSKLTGIECHIAGDIHRAEFMT